MPYQLQSRSINQPSSLVNANFLFSLFFDPEDVHQKHRLTINGVMAQEIEAFITTTERVIYILEKVLGCFQGGFCTVGLHVPLIIELCS